MKGFMLARLKWLVVTIPLLVAGSVEAAYRVHVLLVLDTDSRLPGIGIDRYAIRNVLAEGFPNPNRFEVTELRDKAVTPERVLAYYRQLQVDQTDTLLCFYSGHGSFDPTHGQALMMVHGALWRSQLRAAMEAKRARLVVLWTDCCSTTQVPVGVAQRPPPPPGPESKLLVNLLLQHRGVVDLNASSPGQAAWGDTVHGGLFTFALTESLKPEQFAAMDTDRDGFVGWSEFVPAVRRKLDEVFGEFKERCLTDPGIRSPKLDETLGRQDQQTLYAGSLGDRLSGLAAVPPPGPGRTEFDAPNLGITFVLVAYGNARAPA